MAAKTYRAEEIPAYITAQIEKSGLQRGEFAELLGISRVALHALEKGASFPKVETLRKLGLEARFFRIAAEQ